MREKVFVEFERAVVANTREKRAKNEGSATQNDPPMFFARAFATHPASPPTLIIRYCAACGYAPWAADVAAAVARAAPAWRVQQQPVDSAATFEVEVGDVQPPETVWSKAATGQPVDRAGVAAVAEIVVKELEKWSQKKKGDVS